MSEMAITLPFVFIAFVMVAIASQLDTQQVGQKILFIGSALLFSDFSLVAVGNVAKDLGYTGVENLASGAVVILTVFMLSWFIYMIARIFTDLGESFMENLSG